jgi:hypothetical protein
MINSTAVADYTSQELVAVTAAEWSGRVNQISYFDKFLDV